MMGGDVLASLFSFSVNCEVYPLASTYRWLLQYQFVHALKNEHAVLSVPSVLNFVPVGTLSNE